MFNYVQNIYLEFLKNQQDCKFKFTKADSSKFDLIKISWASIVSNLRF